MLAFDALKDRRCSTCTLQNKIDWGCTEDAKIKIKLDDEILTRCPLVPYKEDPLFYSELFRLYNFREKGILPEDGAFYDQPNYYIDMMLEMESAVNDRMDVTEKFNKERYREEDKKVDGLRQLGFNIQKKP